MNANPWLTGEGARGEAYDERFERLAASGADVHGEAAFVAGLGVRSVLDAGCGTGRVAIELARRGLDVVGVDLDPAMLAAARAKAPELEWVEGDLALVALDRVFDLVVLAGNVMIFVGAGQEGAVLRNLSRHVVDGGWLIAGFALAAGGLDLATYDRLAAEAGLVLAERCATWARDPFGPGADYAVSVHRVNPRPPAGGPASS